MKEICNLGIAEFENKSNEMMKAHIEKFKPCNLDDAVSKGIIENLEGQLTLALEKRKYFEKWGNH